MRIKLTESHVYWIEEDHFCLVLTENCLNCERLIAVPGYDPVMIDFSQKDSLDASPAWRTYQVPGEQLFVETGTFACTNCVDEDV